MGFFKMIFASCLGFFAFLVVCVALVFIIGIGSMRSGKNTASVKPNSILKIDFKHLIAERSDQNSPFDDLNIEGFGSPTPVGITEISAALNYAKTDNNIKAIFLDMGMLEGAGFAQRDVIRKALMDFKTSKKPIYAYAEYYTQGTYYLASTADKVFLNPAGNMAFNGFVSEGMFFKGTLEKLEVEMKLIRGKNNVYKGAGETFTRTDYSQENRLQVSELLNDLYDQYLANIAQSRNISKQNLFQIADSMAIREPNDALRLGLIDGVVYRDQVTDQLMKTVKVEKEKDLKFIELKKYISATANLIDKGNTATNRIAVVYASGQIAGGQGDETSIGSERISKAIRDARLDDKVKAIVLRVNSPGGSALASDVIWREMQLAKKIKPVVVSMSDLAASGGYYIAMPSNKIFAEPSTITGSIGVFTLMPNAQKLMENKFGVTFDRVKTAQYADLGYASKPLSPQEERIIQQGVDKIYSDFLIKVGEGRKKDTAQISPLASGRVYTGKKALELGLVDALGGLPEAIAEAAKLAKIEQYKIKNLPFLENPIEKIFKQSMEETKTKWLANELGIDYKNYQNIKKILKADRYLMQMDLEFDIK